MIEQTGLVMKVRGRAMVVVTDEGDFLELPVRGRAPLVGDWVAVPVRRDVFERSWTWVGAAAAAVVLALSVWLTSTKLQSPALVAYAAIDINPQIELALGKEETVVSATPVNADGERVLSVVDVAGLVVPDAVVRIVETAARLGMLPPNEPVILISYATRGEIPEARVEELRGALDAELRRLGRSAYTAISTVDLKTRAEAVAAHRSLNREVLRRLLDAERVQQLDELPADRAAGRLLREVGLKPADVFTGERWRGWSGEVGATGASTAPTAPFGSGTRVEPAETPAVRDPAPSWPMTPPGSSRLVPSQPGAGSRPSWPGSGETKTQPPSSNASTTPGGGQTPAGTPTYPSPPQGQPGQPTGASQTPTGSQPARPATSTPTYPGSGSDPGSGMHSGFGSSGTSSGGTTGGSSGTSSGGTTGGSTGWR